jgi:mevalonate kinase
MPATTSTAPGKIILFGEHAVVYGRPAIAAPVKEVRARAVVKANPRGPAGEIRIQAPDLGVEAELGQLLAGDPLARAVRGTLAALRLSSPPAMNLRVTSTIPIAAGLGSGAAVSVAVIRALSAFLGRPLRDEQVSSLAYEIEKIHHGSPSGIDNTTITFEKPIFFVKSKPVQIMQVSLPFSIVIADTGIASSTAASVGQVRRAWGAHKDHYEALFDSAGAVAEAARQCIEHGLVESLGPLMDANHGILSKMGVSSPELDHLVKAARAAGAWGAKLSGSGQGGNMIALVSTKTGPQVAEALLEAGAVRAILTQVANPR